MNLSRHFTLAEATFSETAARRNLDNTPDGPTIEVMKLAAAELEKVRKLLGVYVNIKSWYRSPEVNKAIGSGSTSAHIKGWAIDFVAPKFGDARKVAQAIADSALSFDQLIYEGTWVHISFEPKARQQVMTAVFNAGKPTKYVTGIA